ncbi:GNAT family N-acetyltransferase [Pediococcus argentinicus]|uniref:N-acetyltransferase domain-containing protein n=1 Tax=Pediococcus argentinicus TaxID=480391 RepID=A0A0R2NHE8_9LACO|nr:GNAT family N-acetyltransferase [Pediococcus argentinicus]KRO25221.1 hypothetical protein IV88_GL000350 [Pediococcus argentinicus]NKZ22382.1 GNAT family N-acetyltransferase [Pediococcus argentinicus]GEP19481.1 hypothetical protein LSA03_08650 [Pediococcus argentinicus]
MVNKLTNLNNNQLDQIMNLWLTGNIEAHGAYVSDEYWKNNMAMVRHEIEHNADVYVVEKDNQIQGFCGVQEGYIAGIFVSHDAQGQGIGTQLIEAAKRDNNQLVLSVYAKNKKAIKLYENQGFKITKSEIDDETNVEDCEMIWKLE